MKWADVREMITEASKSVCTSTFKDLGQYRYRLIIRNI